jgi:hypothetical protein
MSKQKLSDCEIVDLTHQYAQTRTGRYVAHEAYDEINRQGGEGRQWSKCPNCGDPYPLDQEGAGGGVCSDSCYVSYLAYLNQPGY